MLQLAFLRINLLSTFVLLCSVSSAGDWPQILGPTRNGVAVDEKIVPFDSSGPKLLWSEKVGAGFSGPAVVGDTVYIFHRVEDEEILQAHRVSDGKLLWKSSHEATHRASISPDNGPRAVPLVHDGKVYVYGAAGTLKCVDAKTGKDIWVRNALKDFGAQEGYFGAGSSPIIASNQLLLNVGGRKDSAIVSFDLKIGETKWKSVSDSASYSSPVNTTIDGELITLFITRLKFLGINPKNGEVKFEIPFGARGPTVNGANPLVIKDHVFLTASYNIGAVYAKITQASAKPIWKSSVISSQYTSCVEKDGYIYGTDGRDDGGPKVLKCVEAKSGKLIWSQDDFGVASVLLAGDLLILLDTDGKLTLASASPDGYEEKSSHQLFSSTTRAIPALSNGRYFSRDQSIFKVIDLSR